MVHFGKIQIIFVEKRTKLKQTPADRDMEQLDIPGPGV